MRKLIADLSNGVMAFLLNKCEIPNLVELSEPINNFLNNKFGAVPRLLSSGSAW
jgi:hypothetical protein